MPDYKVVLPSKPKVVEETDTKGVYEIEGFYPGFGHTIGNSLRRIIHASTPGASVTSVKIDGVGHEFSTISGIKEDVITILLNIKKLRFRMETDEPLHATIKIKGAKKVTAKDIELPGQIEISDKDLYICEVTDKNTELKMELKIEKGLGYVSKEVLHRDKVEIGTIALDATFSPIRRANYEVENMRVGDRTDFNKLRLFIETDGVITPRETLERAIMVMINQLKAVVGFKEEEVLQESAKVAEDRSNGEEGEDGDDTEEDPSKVKVEDLDLSTRTLNALVSASIKTVGGISRKTEDDLLATEGLGAKAVEEIKRAISQFGITLKK